MKGIRLTEEVDDEGRRVCMERGKEKLLEVLDAESRRPRRQGASDVELRESIP